MIIFLLMVITVLVGLAVSIGMMYATNHHHPYESAAKAQTQQGRDDFFQRLKLNAARLKY